MSFFFFGRPNMLNRQIARPLCIPRTTKRKTNARPGMDSNSRFQFTTWWSLHNPQTKGLLLWTRSFGMKETCVILLKKLRKDNFEDLNIHLKIIFNYIWRKWCLRIWRHFVLHGVSYQYPLYSNSYEINNEPLCQSERLWVGKVMFTVF